MKRKKTRLITKIAVLCLVAYAVVFIVQRRTEYNQKQSDYKELCLQVESQKRHNAMLKDNSNIEMDKELIAEAARNELGLVSPGERIFVDISN